MSMIIKEYDFKMFGISKTGNVAYNKENFYDYLIRNKNINMEKTYYVGSGLNTKTPHIYIRIETFSKKKKDFEIELCDFLSDIDALLSYFGFYKAKTWKTPNLIPGNEAIEDFYKYRVAKASRYLAEKRKKALDKVIEKAMDDNEFLGNIEEEEGWKL